MTAAHKLWTLAYKLEGTPNMLRNHLLLTSLLMGAATACTTTATDPTQSSQPEIAATEQPALSDYDFMYAAFDEQFARTRIVEDGASATIMADKMEIRFSAQENISALDVLPPVSWNAADFDNHNIAFEVENLSSESTHLYVALESGDGAIDNRSISLPGRFSGTLYLALSGPAADAQPGIWGRPAPWVSDETQLVWRSTRSKLDRDAIESIRFQTIGLLQDTQILVSDIRLRPNPDIDATWLADLVDEFGQNAKIGTRLTVETSDELKALADAELAELDASTGMSDRSRFGGYKDGPKLPSSGFFRTAKVDGKWWLVDPDGYLFFSHGPANVRMANMTTITGRDYADDSIRVVNEGELTPEDSMGIIKIPQAIRDTAFVTNQTRYGMFEWLPEYESDLGDHYSYGRSTHIGPVEHGETFSFYRANLERRYGETYPESYFDKWVDVTQKRMKHWGFTSFGNWVDPAFYQTEQVPYFANGWIIGDFQTLSGEVNHWGLMPDVFDPVFAERAKATIDAIAADVKGSPWCSGIFFDNEKSWGEREGTIGQRYGVILDALSKDAATSPAKAAFSAHLKDQYGSISNLNTAWDSAFETWAAFDTSATYETYTDAQVADLSRLLEMLGVQYFEVVRGTLKDALPNHLYMGARLANWGMPDEIISASLKYSDALSFNIYEQGVQPEHWAFLEDLDMPVVIGEFHIGANEGSGFYNPGIVHAADQADRARMYTNYMESVAANPYFVGAHWFQYIDEPITGRAFDGENAQIGFVTVTDLPYPELIDAVSAFNSTLYSNRYEAEE